MKNTLFKHTFILFCTIGVLDFMANRLYFYWTIWWFDMMMHFLAGVCVAMIAVLLWNKFIKELYWKRNKIIFVGFIGVLFVGVLWEVYEVYFNLSIPEEGWVFWRDTMSDLVIDIFGGFLGSIYSYKILSKSRDII